MSCLVDKFSYYSSLDESDTALLRELEKQEQTYAKRAVIYDKRSDNAHIYIVKEGWCVTFTDTPDGGRLALNIHFPGDIVGASAMPFQETISGLMTATKATLCPFAKEDMARIMRRAPGVASLIYAMALQENVTLTDRLKSIARLSGDLRVALLLLQTHARLRITDKSAARSFEMPLSQELIADATGLTPVYVSRMLKKLRAEGYIAVENKKITLTRYEELCERCDFSDRFYALDPRWLSG